MTMWQSGGPCVTWELHGVHPTWFLASTGGIFGFSGVLGVLSDWFCQVLCLHWVGMCVSPLSSSWDVLCHALPQYNPTEPHHACTHLTMDCDLIQSRHCHAGQHRTVSDLAISDISGHLQTGRDGALTAHALHSATFSSTYF